ILYSLHPLFVDDIMMLRLVFPPWRGVTIAELHAMVKLYEKGIPKKAETPAVLAIREGRIQKDKKKPKGEKGKASSQGAAEGMSYCYSTLGMAGMRKSQVPRSFPLDLGMLGLGPPGCSWLTLLLGRAWVQLGQALAMGFGRGCEVYRFGEIQWASECRWSSGEKGKGGGRPGNETGQGGGGYRLKLALRSGVPRYELVIYKWDIGAVAFLGVSSYGVVYWWLTWSMGGGGEVVDWWGQRDGDSDGGCRWRGQCRCPRVAGSWRELGLQRPGFWLRVGPVVYAWGGSVVGVFLLGSLGPEVQAIGAAASSRGGMSGMGRQMVLLRHFRARWVDACNGRTDGKGALRDTLVDMDWSAWRYC
ncbi:hypothetical protein Tco_0199448, partial [Tanacetum coccineum]